MHTPLRSHVASPDDGRGVFLGLGEAFLRKMERSAQTGIEVPFEIRRSLHGKTVLVTGGSGYLGNALARLLRRTGCRLRLWTRQATQEPLPGDDTLGFHGELLDDSAWQEAVDGVDVVFHLAAQTSVSVAADDPSADWRANVLPLIRLLETCRARKWTPTVLFAGTATEAGLTDTLPVTEDMRDEPITVYDVHKLTAELYLKIYATAGVCRGVTLRLSNVYGPGPASGAKDRGVLNTMVRKALQGKPLTVFGDGSFLRDYVYVEDVAWAFLFAASRIERINGRHFLIGSGEGHTLAAAVKLVAERVSRVIGKVIPVSHVALPPTQTPIDTRNFVADVSRFCKATGWRPRTRLEDGIDLTIASLLPRSDEQ